MTKYSKNLITFSLIFISLICILAIILVISFPSDNALNNNVSPSSTPTPIITFTSSLTPTLTASPIITNTFTPTNTSTLTLSPTRVITPTQTIIRPTLTITQTPITVPSEISIGNQNKKQIIFTFDGGSGTQSADKILNTLKKFNVKGTFFLTGRWEEQNVSLTRRIINEGHEIFNHSYSHPRFTEISDSQIKNELQTMENINKNLTSKTTKPFFRPPYGARNNHIREVAAREGYRSVYWTADALDWQTGITSEQVKARIYSNQKNGAIILMHIGDIITGDILEEVFIKVLNDGYKIVSLTQGL